MPSQTLRPNGIGGGGTNWAPTGAATNWQATNEAVADDDTSYVSTSTQFVNDDYTIDDLTPLPGGAVITNVAMTIRSRKVDTGFAQAIEAYVHIGASYYLGLTYTLPDDTAYHEQVINWAVSPATGIGWTETEVNGTSLDYRKSDAVAHVLRVTQVFATVTYGLSAITPSRPFFAPQLTGPRALRPFQPGILDVPGADATAGGSKWKAYKVLSDATTNPRIIKNSPGTVGPITLVNTSGATRYLHLYDAISVRVGISVPTLTIEIPTTEPLVVADEAGMTFSQGISYSLTTGPADNDATAVGAGEITGAICWI